MGTLFQHIDDSVIQADSNPRPEQSNPALTETDSPKHQGAETDINENVEPDRLSMQKVINMAAQNRLSKLEFIAPFSGKPYQLVVFHLQTLGDHSYL